MEIYEDLSTSSFKYLRKLHEHENMKFELKFWGLNLSENKLLSYNEFVKRLREFEKLGLIPIFHQQRR